MKDRALFSQPQDKKCLEYALKATRSVYEQYVAELEEYDDIMKMHAREGSLKTVAPEIHEGHEELQKQCEQYEDRIAALENILNNKPITKAAKDSLLQIGGAHTAVVAKYTNIDNSAAQRHHAHVHNKKHRCVIV